ncbi:hypothetical protein ACU639_17790 [Streptomyces cynarae]|uniref:hypothetical protein n=1 Tax=Streptomyces cynarae TaxID=2981134 RepID=UPI00406D29BC
MGFHEHVSTSFKTLRRGDGLSAIALGDEDHQTLLRLLGTTDPYVGAERLTQLTYKLGDTREGKAVRAALAVGVDRLSGTKARREALEKELLISDSVRWRAERKGFEELVRLVLDYPQQHVAENDPFQDVEPFELEPGDLDVPPAEPENPSTTNRRGAPWLRRSSDALTWIKQDTKTQVALAFIALLVSVIITVPFMPKNRTTQETASPVDAATANPPRATVSTAPNEKVDNTRGWGPGRKTFTMKHPASFPVFNSITDQPNYGDERNFVQCHDVADKGKPGGGWGDSLLAQDGHTYECMVLFVNDVAPNLDTIASPNTGGNIVAKLQNARLKVLRPEAAIYNPAVVGVLSADNTNPAEVWDSCNFIAPRKVELTYVPGSARMFTNTTPTAGLPLNERYQGSQMTTGILSKDGALLGSKQDGLVGQDGGYVLLDFKVTLAGE